MSVKITELYKDLQNMYEQFVQQASIVFSEQSDTHSRASMQSTPMHKTAKSFVYQWAAFIELINELESEGLAPFISRVNSSFDDIFNSLYTIRTSMPVIRFRTDIACVALDRFQSGVIALRDQISRMVLAKKEERFEGFMPLEFKKKITVLMHQISDLYGHALPHSCLSTAKTQTTRFTMSSAIAGISIAVNMAREADATYASLKGQIMEVNQQLTRVCRHLSLPFCVSLVFDDDEVPEEGVEITGRKIHVVNV